MAETESVKHHPHFSLKCKGNFKVSLTLPFDVCHKTSNTASNMQASNWPTI
jgi:hypothetical protein